MLQFFLLCWQKLHLILVTIYYLIQLLDAVTKGNLFSDMKNGDFIFNTNYFKIEFACFFIELHT